MDFKRTSRKDDIIALFYMLSALLDDNILNIQTHDGSVTDTNMSENDGHGIKHFFA